MTLTDDYIVAEVLSALREIGEGRASLAMAGERLMRRFVGLEHEWTPAYDARPGLLQPDPDSGLPPRRAGRGAPVPSVAGVFIRACL